MKMNEEKVVDSNFISKWLDKNPQFLTEYLRKMQLQRRDAIMNDDTSQMLANLYSNLRLQPHSLSSDNNVKKPTSNTISQEVEDLFNNEAINEFDLNHNNNDTNKRKQFKELGLYEKMYALVKALYQSLDLKTTCKKILKTVSLLLDADRCSLFLVVDDDEFECKKALVSVVFDAQSLNKQISSNEVIKQSICNDDTKSNEQIKLPYGIGIAGYVASTGLPLNITDAYLDDRFNPSIDKKTGYKTKSILCLPILNELGECVAVAEAINKLGDDDSLISFTSKDEEIFSKFMPFISIAIRNSNLYAKSRKEAFVNKILLTLATTVFDEQTTVDNLVSKIICHALFLLECEHCQVVLLQTHSKSSKIKQSNKLFDRVYELNYSELPTDPFSSPLCLKPVNSTSIRYPIDFNLFQQVVETGEFLNIKNTQNYECFKKITSLNSCLCIPVKNNNDQVVCVIFAFNKMQNSNSLNIFSSLDINAAKAFALFCGIGIQNIIMYEKVVRAMNMQQVALDVLSYHASAKHDEVKQLITEPPIDTVNIDLHLFSFDEQRLDDLSTLKACIGMFYDFDLIDKFNIQYETLCNFFMTVKKNYRPVAYHNWRHGFNVMSSMYAIITQGKYQTYFSSLEILSLLIASICHDVDHRGTTNTFQIKIQSPLAKLYSTSTMEQHHYNQFIMILHSNVNNILINLNAQEYSNAMEIIEKAILATDLSLHFQKVDSFLEKIKNPTEKRFESNEDKELFISMLMTGCDLSGSTKPWDCHHRLSKLVSKEFFEQGDLEKERFQNEPIDIMNRNKEDKLPEMQVQFLQSVCLPLYNGLYLSNEFLKPLFDGCEENIKKWKELAANSS